MVTACAATNIGPVNSATPASWSGSPSASNATPKSDSLSSPIQPRVRSSTGQPIEYSTRRPRLPCAAAVFKAVRWSMMPWRPRPVDGDQHVGAP